MSWTEKTKIAQEVEEEEIVTPDSEQVLVGASEDEVLISREGYSNWGLLSKTTNSWGLKTKISS